MEHLATTLLLEPMLRCGHVLRPPVGGGDGRGADGRAKGVGSTLPARFPLRRWMNGGSGSVENAVGGETATGELAPGAEQADHGRKRSVHLVLLNAVPCSPFQMEAAKGSATPMGLASEWAASSAGRTSRNCSGSR